MKAIIIIGKKDAGKSTTIQEICRQLAPNKIWQLKINTSNEKESELKESSIDAIYNDVFIVKVQSKYLLIVAGCPTELDITITMILDACSIIKIEVPIIILAKRTSERKKNFNSIEELEKMGYEIFEEKIQKIELKEFRNSFEWQDRINRLKEMIQNEL